LAQGLANPGLGEFILAYDAFGIDPQQDFDAVPGPFRDLCRVYAAVQPRRQASMAEVVGPPGEGRGGVASTIRLADSGSPLA